jgi:hypothetical protein
MGELRLATQKTIIRRTVTLGDDGTAFITAYLPVEKDDDETGKPKRFTLGVTLSRSPDGTIRVHGPVAHLIGDAMDLPEGIGVDLPRVPPPTSHDGAMMSIETITAILAGERPDIARLYHDLKAAFLTFVAFPADEGVTPEDYAAFCAAYVISTYLLAAFPAVGYVWLTGLPGSGKSTVATIIARLAFLPLMASASSTLAALRGHADAGGTLVLDNWDTITNKDDTTRTLRSFCEIGYTPGALVALQVPSSTGRGWETARCNVYANRVFTAVAEPPDALDSRCIKVLMFRTDDASKGARSPWDDENWPVAPHDLIQQCWMVALYHLADAARIVRTITGADSGLTNRDLQVWRPVLAVARIVDAANGDTAVTDALARLARWLLKQRAEDDGSREATVTRALVAIVKDGNRTTTTSLALSMVRKLYAEENGEPPHNPDSKKEPPAPFGLDTAAKLGRLFRRMNVPKLPRTSKGNVYDLSESVMDRLAALYLPKPLLTVAPEPTPPAQPAQPTYTYTPSVYDPTYEDWPESAGSEGNAGSVGSGATVQDAMHDEGYGGDVTTDTVADDVIADAWSALITWASGRCDPFTDAEEDAARIVALRIVPGESLGRTASRVFEQERAWRTGSAEGMAADD